MQLLHCSPVSIAEFASLSLLMDASVYGEKASADTVTLGESVMVVSPLATTPAADANQCLAEVHDHVFSVFQAKKHNDTLKMSTTESLDKPRTSCSDGLFSEQSPTHAQHEYLLQQHQEHLNFRRKIRDKCFYEDVSHILDGSVQVYRPSRSRGGIALYFLVICNKDLIRKCTSFLHADVPSSAVSSLIEIPSHNRSHFVAHDSQVLPFSQNVSERAEVCAPVLAAILCVGVTGIPHCYSSSPSVNSLPGRISECVSLIAQLENAPTELDAQRRLVSSILTSVLMDDEDLKTDAMVNSANGAAISEAAAALDVVSMKSKASKYLSSGMGVAKIPRKVLGKKNKFKSEDEVSGNCSYRASATTAHISASSSSSDVARIVAEQIQVLSFSEKDMTLRSYEAKLRRRASAESIARLRNRKRIDLKPLSRVNRKLGKDVASVGSDLTGFDYTAPNKVGAERRQIDQSDRSTNSKADLFLSCSVFPGKSQNQPVTIPTLSGPSRDSTASHRDFRKSRVLAASAASQLAKQLAGETGYNGRMHNGLTKIAQSCITLNGKNGSWPDSSRIGNSLPVVFQRHQSEGSHGFSKPVGMGSSAERDDRFDIRPPSRMLPVVRRRSDRTPPSQLGTQPLSSLPRRKFAEREAAAGTASAATNFDPFAIGEENHCNVSATKNQPLRFSFGAELAAVDCTSNCALESAPSSRSFDTNGMSSVDERSTCDSVFGTDSVDTNKAEAYHPNNSELLEGALRQPLASTDSPPRLLVNVALNEDLTCSYRSSKISSFSIEGVIQIQVKSDSAAYGPFTLFLRDPAKHVKTIQENKTYADNLSHEVQLFDQRHGASPDYKFNVTVPRADHYFPIMRYKCTNALRPVPLRVQTRVRYNGMHCRVALQISSNPANEDDLTNLTIIMAVPAGVKGETLSTLPDGGVWNATKRSVLWCVAELGEGKRFQLQAQFEVEKRIEESAEDDRSSFPVLVRCQCMYSQLSKIEVDVSDIPNVFPSEVTMKVARRFRLSHREKA